MNALGQVVADGTRWGSQEWYDRRWADVPEPLKEKIVAHLREQLSPEFLAAYKEGAFVHHFFQGMSIRNLLRDVVTDDELPAAPYPDGQSYRNWDDYYTQALRAAATT